MPRFLVVLATVSACSSGPLPATGSESTEEFPSAVVGDDYLLRIRVPPGYDPNGMEAYPLVIQLDPTFLGSQQYATTVGLISTQASEGVWDEAIVVGVDYPDDPGLRTRDYLPPDPPSPDFSGEGADRFYAMLEDELLPYLDAEHAIDTDRRYLLAHSNGGVFAWYAAFRQDPDGPAFAGVVAADCGYDEPLFIYERWYSERAADLPLAIFATRAAFNGALQKVTFEAMVERLRGRDYPSLRLETAVLETDHGGAMPLSYEQGLDLMLGAAP